MKQRPVSGGAGFIGANFNHYTLKNHQDYAIICVDSPACTGSLSTLKEDHSPVS